MIRMEELVADFRGKIQSVSIQEAGASTVRMPRRPMVITFLGKYPAEGKRRFDTALQIGWPTTHHRIDAREKVYQTPEEFLSAIETEDQEGNTSVDHSIRDASNDPGLRSPDLVMVYFLSFDDERAGEYLKLLDRDYTTPMGGDKDRLLISIGKATTKKAKERLHRFVQILSELSENPDSEAKKLWDSTCCLLLSDYQRGLMTLSEEEYLDNYTLAMDVLLAQYSISTQKDNFRPKKLPGLREGKLLTAALRRESKPTEQIARALLYQYLRRGIELANSDSSKEIDFTSLLQAGQDEVKGLYRELSNQFPSEEELLFFPNGAATGRDVGEDGGADKTLGTWRLFCQQYFIGKVLDACGNQETLKGRFKRFLSREKGCSCGVIQKHFPDLMSELDRGESTFISIYEPKPEDSLITWGQYHAKVALRRLCYAAMIEAVQEMSSDATNYANMLGSLSGQVLPADESVRMTYANIVDRHMGDKRGEDTMEDILGYPCNEDEMEDRLKKFVEAAVGFREVRMSFFDDLRARFSDANSKIEAFMAQSLEVMRNDARMPVSALEAVYHVFLYDSEMLGVPSDTLFELCNTNSMDRVVVYEFNNNGLN